MSSWQIGHEQWATWVAHDGVMAAAADLPLSTSVESGEVWSHAMSTRAWLRVEESNSAAY